jgi:hypothetical protein
MTTPQRLAKNGVHFPKTILPLYRRRQKDDSTLDRYFEYFTSFFQRNLSVGFWVGDLGTETEIW